MSKSRRSSTEVKVYTNGKLVKSARVLGGPAPGYVGKHKASAAAKAARRKDGR